MVHGLAPARVSTNTFRNLGALGVAGLSAEAHDLPSLAVAPVCCLPPLFLKCVQFLLMNTLDFQANLLETWARIRPNSCKKFGGVPIETLATANTRYMANSGQTNVQALSSAA